MFALVPPLFFRPLMIGPLGMQEMLIILVVALIVFGPRKLPQIGKTLGKSIAEFRRTSTELRSTLEREVQMEEFRTARSEVLRSRKGGRGPRARARPGRRLRSVCRKAAGERRRWRRRFRRTPCHPGEGSAKRNGRLLGLRPRDGSCGGSGRRRGRGERSRKFGTGVDRRLWQVTRRGCSSTPRKFVSDSDPTDRPDGPADRMTFLEHLDELRRRLIRAAIAILVAFVGCFFFYEQIFDFLMRPLRQVIEPLGGELIATTPPEIFLLGIKMSFLVAIVVSTPAWLGQVWGFVAPGLYRHERHVAFPFILVGSAFFISGAAFCHYVLFPAATQFLGTFGGGGEDIEIRYRVSEVFSFYARLVLATAVVFQIPTLALLLSRLGLISPSFLWRYFKYAVLMSFRDGGASHPARSHHADHPGRAHDRALHAVYRDRLDRKSHAPPKEVRGVGRIPAKPVGHPPPGC